jgi:adenine-specific DNA-methyltransferase
MFLEYPNKRSEDEILKNDIEIGFSKKIQKDNILFFGDNFVILKKLLYEEGYKGKIDLVYIDPPFATNTKFKIGKDRISTISNSNDDDIAYEDTLSGYKFLEFLRERLILIRELLSEKGSIYLHIDYKIGHYVKIIMDEVFGVENFRNDITRIKCNPKNFKRNAYGNIKDMILFYSKSKNPIFNDPKEPYSKEDIEKLFPKVDKNGRRYTTIPLHAPGETKDGKTGKEWRGLKPPRGRHWRSKPEVLEELDKKGLIEWSKNGNPRRIIYADEKEGKKKQDIWDYKDAQYPIYPTEKNLNMIKAIILASSNKDSIVMDCFCGSGGTLKTATDLGRKWIGIDSSKKAIEVTKERLRYYKDNLFLNQMEYDFITIDKTKNKLSNISSNINFNNNRKIKQVGT